MTDPSTETPGQPLLIRHIAPVFIGGAVALLLTLVTDNTLSAHQVLTTGDGGALDTASLLLTAAYRGLFAILGCHMAARLAPPGQPRIRYALALGGLMLVMNVIAAISYRGQVPFWYSLIGIALPIPYAIIGGGTAVQVLARARQR